MINKLNIRNSKFFSYRNLLIIGLTLFWLLLSGYWTNLLILTLGAASVSLAIWISMRIEQKYSFNEKGIAVLIRLHTFWPWLFKETVKSNIAVLKCIWKPKTYPITPIIRQLKMQPQTRIGRTIYANSITFTPGTVSIEVRDTDVLVYALLEESMQDLEYGEMGQRVHKLEGKD